MKTKVRNHLASLCMKHVKLTDPEIYNFLEAGAIVNYETGKPKYALGEVYRLALFAKQEKKYENVN